MFTSKRDCKTNGKLEKCKTNAIQTNLGIFTHSAAYSDLFRNYLGIFWTLAYSELWYIQYPCKFKTRGISRTLVYPKLWHIQNQRHSESWVSQNPEIFRTGVILRTLPNIYNRALWERANDYNYFRNISFSCPLLYERYMIFLVQV